MKKIEEIVENFLLTHGLSKEDVSSKTPKELKTIYTQGLKAYTKRFLQEAPKQQEQILENPFLQLRSPQELFDIELNFFEHFSLEDIMLMLSKKFEFINIKQVQEITKILFFAFQESILQEIEEKLKKLPREESQSILEIYEQQKSDIEHLISINKKLESEDFREKLQIIINIKALIQKESLEES